MEELNKISQELKFWFERVEWSRLPEGSFDGTLFSVRLALPIDLPTLDEACAPYISGYGPQAHPVPSLRELITSETLTEGFGLHPTNRNVQEQIINQVSIVNLTENEQGDILQQPVHFCHDQGWWCISFRICAIVPNVDESCVEHTQRADALLELLGKPTCIMVADRDRDAFNHALRNGYGRLCYYLVYEWEEYVLVFRISDVVSSELSLTALAVLNCMYYAKPLWEYDKEGKHIIWTSNHKLKG